MHIKSAPEILSEGIPNVTGTVKGFKVELADFGVTDTLVGAPVQKFGVNVIELVLVGIYRGAGFPLYSQLLLSLCKSHV